MKTVLDDKVYIFLKVYLTITSVDPDASVFKGNLWENDKLTNQDSWSDISSFKSINKKYGYKFNYTISTHLTT